MVMRESPGAFPNMTRLLAELGISRAKANRWMRVAAIPEEVFDAALVATVGREDPITEADILALDRRFEAAAIPLCHPEVYDVEGYRAFVLGGRADSDYRKAPIPDFVAMAILRRDNGACRYCGDTFDLSIDHVVPEALGGMIDAANLVAACRPCNARKGTRLLGPPGWTGWRGWALAI